MAAEASFSEYRSVEFLDVELKDRKLHGYAAVFNMPWDERMTREAGYVEELRRGLFRKAIPRSGDIPLLWQHDRNQFLARTGSGSLMLEEDGKGLRVEATLPKSGLGEYVRELIDRGDVRGMSYGRLAGRDDQTIERRGGIVHRVVHDARKILDVALTWEPTYPGAAVELRTQGFVVTPLQEILGGPEGQTEEAAAGDPPDEPETEAETPATARRLAELRIQALEEGRYP